VTLNQIKFFALAVRRLYVKCAFMDAADNDLDGHCQWISYALLVLLRERGVAVEMCYGRFLCPSLYDAHCWLRLPEHRVHLDISATQFGRYPAVYVTPYKRATRRYRIEQCNELLVEESAEDNFIGHEVVTKFRRRYGRVLHPLGAGLTDAAQGPVQQLRQSRSCG
jgi:RNase P/RNase MRP subunit p30